MESEFANSLSTHTEKEDKMLHKYRVFKLAADEYPNEVLVFIPMLSKLFLIPVNKADAVGDYISTSRNPRCSHWHNLPDYAFWTATLLMTNRCNLCCIYCYEECSPEKNQTMEQEVAFAAVDYIIGWASKLKFVPAITLFGGEPSQAWNETVSVTEYFRRRAAHSGLRNKIQISTNGCVNDDQIEWLLKNMDGINISLDGYKLIQDLQRSGSFERTFRTAKKAYKVFPQKVRFRSTITAFSVNYLSEIVQFISENFPGTQQRYEPLFSMGRALKLECQPPDYDLFFKKFLDSVPIARKYNCKLKTSALVLSHKSREFFCGIGGRNFMIAPDGRVVACNRMAEKGINAASDLFCFGHYDGSRRQFVFNDANYQKLKVFGIESIAGCQDCFARVTCRGDCVANKAVMSPTGFWREKSYRCEAIKKFTKNVLFHIIKHGKEGLVI